jgi:hypothetical protein
LKCLTTYTKKKEKPQEDKAVVEMSEEKLQITVEATPLDSAVVQTKATITGTFTF